MLSFHTHRGVVPSVDGEQPMHSTSRANTRRQAFPTRSSPRQQAQDRLHAAVDFFFLLASAFSRFSFTLNSTILVMRSKGMGWSRGNLTVPFDPS